MDIRRLYHLHHRFTFLKAWYLLLPAILFALLAVHGLRSNYSTMATLREAVYTADQQGGDVELSLQNLRRHVHGHMNTNLASGSNAIKPPIQLKARYERLLSAERERLKAVNADVTARAEQTCASQFPASGFNAPRVACIQDYVGVNGEREKSIPDSLYKFDFVSPSWSFDIAGVSLVLSSVFFILFAARIILERYMRKRLE